MYGLIGQIEAVEGKRVELGRILSEMGSIPGCLHYIVANDSGDPDVIWVTEVWESKDAHQASLDLPAVQEAIRVGQPMIVGFKSRNEVQPIGGI